jgi:hypothetical protein
VYETSQTWAIHIFEGLALIFAALTYAVDRRKDRREVKQSRELEITGQIRMHEENRLKLERLQEFNQEQHQINIRRDKQLGELVTQTARLTEIAIATNRRLEMLENND